MALASYTDLQSVVATYFPRTDQIANIPTFISLFETRLNRELRVRQMEASTPLAPSSGVATLPTDFLEVRRVVWNGNAPITLQFATPDYIQDSYQGITGLPIVYTIMGSQLTVAPADDTSLTLNYYQQIPALSVASPTNWFMTAYPDAYLKGTLVECFTFTRDTDNATMWESRLQQALGEILKLDLRTRNHGPVRAYGPTP